MVNSIEELARMIARRDGISFNEAMNCIDDCQNELNYLFQKPYYGYDEVCDTIDYLLGLEPDYLDILLG